MIENLKIDEVSGNPKKKEGWAWNEVIGEKWLIFQF